MGSIGLIAASIGMAALVTACGDRSLEDYKREKMNQDLSRFDAAKGDYQGVAFSKNSGAELGLLVAEVESRKGDAAHLNVRLVFEGATHAEMTIPREIDFDENTGDYEGQYVLTRPGEDPIQLRLVGNFANGTFSGDLSAEGYSDYGMRFGLTRTDKASLASAIEARRNARREAPSDSIGFVNNYYQGRTENGFDVYLNIRMNIPSPEQEFAIQFLPRRTVQITMENGLPSGTRVKFAEFPSVEWDLRRNRLNGVGQSRGSGGNSNRSDLLCVQKSFPDAAIGWTCKFASGVSNGKGGFTADFRPVE